MTLRLKPTAGYKNLSVRIKLWVSQCELMDQVVSISVIFCKPSWALMKI